MKTIKEQMAEAAGDYTRMRKAQYDEDVVAMLMSLDPAEFKKMKLRWGLPAPPTGFGDTDTVMKAIHMGRVVCKVLPMEERMKSVRFVSSVNLALPPLVLLQGDVLTGTLVDVA